MRILVTGAAGFIGSSVSEALLKRGDEVVGLDNFDKFYARAIKADNLGRLQQHKSFDFIEGDILDPEAVRSALNRRGGTDGVIHLAALAGVRPSLLEPARYMRVNVEGTARLLEVARDHGVQRYVVASSSSVYGARSQTPFSESDSCDRPASPYAASKKATEVVCATYCDLYELSIACLRYFTVYGPRQRPEMAIHRFVRCTLSGEAIPMFGKGDSARDYTFIDDIVAGTVSAFDRRPSGTAFDIYNLGGTRPVSLGRLIELIGEATGRKPQIDQQPLQPGDVPITCANIQRAAADLDYSPQVDLNRGLARFVDWYRNR